MESNLREYLAASAKPFSWESHNCMSFVMGWLDIEELPVELFLGCKTADQAYFKYVRECYKRGYPSLYDYFHQNFHREFTLHPKDGWVVGRKAEDGSGHLYGLTIDQACVFLNTVGLEFVNLHPSDTIWCPYA